MINRNNIIKLILTVFALITIAVFCVIDGSGHADTDYVRYEGHDLAIYHDDSGSYIFLPQYANVGRIKYTNAFKKNDPVIVRYSGLPTIFIDTAHGNLDKVYEDKEHRETGKIYIYNDSGEKEYSGGLEYIKGRGNYTWASEEWTKKPFTISLKKEDSILGQPAGSKYALIANSSDDTLVRNDLARRIQEELGVEYAHRGAYAGLYIDGEFQGIYYLCATPEISSDRIDISGSGMDITGGYLIERELPERIELEAETITASFCTESGENFVIHTPGYATDGQVDYLRDYVNKAESAIMSPEGKDASGISYEDYIDLRSFELTYLTEELIKNYDAGVTSAFYYKGSDSKDGRLCCAPGWDYDMALGSYQDWMEYDDPEGLTEMYPHSDASVWYTELIRKDEFGDAVTGIYMDKREALARILYGEGLQEVRGGLDGAYEAEYLRWKQMYDGRGSVPGSDDAFNDLRLFAQDRMKYLDTIWITE